MKNRTVKKITEEVVECYRIKAQKRSSKNLHRKDQHDYNNCFKILSKFNKNAIALGCTKKNKEDIKG